MLQPEMRESMLARYTTEHAVEYVIVTLFFWGMFDILVKLSAFPREILAARYEWLPPRNGREPIAKAQELLDHVRKNRPWLITSRIGRRLVNVLTFVSEKGCTDDYREQIQHLADVDDQESHTNYTVLRFVIAVTPILGFLGTVVHFGAAIGSFSFDDMDARLPEIVGGMGTAFNTTSVALATAMTMMFAMFLCERVERNIVDTIDRFIDSELLNRFEVREPSVQSFLSTVNIGNQQALDSLRQTMQEQTRIWTRHIDMLFEHFEKRQHQGLSRDQASLELLRQRYEAYESTREDQMRQLISIVDARHDQHANQIQQALDRAMLFRNDINDLVQALNSLARGEGRLVELQATLSDNLRLLNESGQIDSAIHGLIAAIHLMTTRSRPFEIPDSKAA
jgi:biopolymer transport protein ExbB/TolQ